MPDLEQRLRNVLSAQADTVETDLSGADLRALAEDRVRTRRRTAAQALVAAVVVAVIGLAPQVFTGPERAHRPAPSPIAPGFSVSPPSRQPTPSRSRVHERHPRGLHRTATPTPQRPEPTTTPAVSATPRGQAIPSRSTVTTRSAPPVSGYRPPAAPRTPRPNATNSP